MEDTKMAENAILKQLNERLNNDTLSVEELQIASFVIMNVNDTREQARQGVVRN